jgi:aspartate aminotransferase-like enzyme
VVLANGAFGERLAAHARAWRLDHCVARWPWGEAIDLEDASRALSEPGLSWVWLVHCETSTGVMNDLATVNAMAKRRGLKVAADCISSLGAAPTELRDMDWAAGVSSKGLGAPAGLSFVCHAEEAEPAPDRLPRYLDLGLYDGRNDSPWTFPSNLLTALQAALPHAACAERQATLAEHGRAFQQACRERGLRVLAPEACAAPAVTTLALPASAASCDAARALLGHGATVAWASDYLLERNWIQVCLMGAYDADMLRRLPGLLEEAVAVRA